MNEAPKSNAVLSKRGLLALGLTAGLGLTALVAGAGGREHGAEVETQEAAVAAPITLLASQSGPFANDIQLPTLATILPAEVIAAAVPVEPPVAVDLPVAPATTAPAPEAPAAPAPAAVEAPAPAPEPEPVAEAPVEPSGSVVEDAIATYFPENFASALEVARCESSLNPDAIGGGKYYGLFQIGTLHQGRVEAMGYSWDQILDPYVNSAVARALYDEQGWRPWSCRWAA